MDQRQILIMAQSSYERAMTIEMHNSKGEPVDEKKIGQRARRILIEILEIGDEVLKALEDNTQQRAKRELL